MDSHILFGRTRANFRCDCGMRMVKIIGFGRLFLHRHCSDLCHYIKNEDFGDRSLQRRTMHKLRVSRDASRDAYKMPKLRLSDGRLSIDPEGRSGGKGSCRK